MIYHEILKLLCVEYKVCSIEYFMDFMLEYEVEYLVEYVPYLDINEWEKTRLLVYTIAQTQSTKKLDMREMMKFPWDNNEETHDYEISNEDIERLKQKAEIFSKLRYGNTNNKTNG